MSKTLLVLLLMTPYLAMASDRPAVDTRLAKMVEAVVGGTGFSSINISATTNDSVSIDKIDGLSVCDPASAAKVRKLQEAFDAYPGVGDDFGPAFFSILNKDGTRKRMAPEVVIKRGLAAGCTDVHVSIVHD